MSKTSSILNLSLKMSRFSRVEFNLRDLYLAHIRNLTNSTRAVDCMLSLITIALSNNPAGILTLATEPDIQIKSRGKLTPLA